MANQTYTAQYKSHYTTFSGADIVATFSGKVVGELQAISYSVTREKTPIYTMGSPDPRSFSRGKRGIAGSMVFTVFNKDALDVLQTTDERNIISTAYANARPTTPSDIDETPSLQIMSPDEWEAEMEQEATPRKYFKDTSAYYVDEIMPFDVTITMHNEYGQAARFSLIGCEILNEGSGMSIDDVTTEKACTFVARSLSKLTPILNVGTSDHTGTN